ncbi:MAG: sigma-70 family RNA polymerase sigma factor [Clostridiaceae bacterium]|nr:sigma-70 family RNA polymerase sigma factor [Clostridiaceae bacterium]
MTNEELVKEYREGDNEALDQLIQKNTGLVKYFANKYCGIAQNTSLEYEDLEQEGWIAFIDAIEKYEFNEDEPVLFSTYAGMRVKYKILTYLNRNICRTKKSDISSEPVTMCSINQLLPGTEDMTLEDSICDESAEEPFRLIEEEIDNGILRQDLIYLIETVLGRGPGPLRNILIMHYGLRGKPMSFNKIGERFKMSGSRIQQIEFDALKKIRNSEEGKELMKKYKWMLFNHLDREKEFILKENSSPEHIVERIESIDELLFGILKECC